MPPLRPPNRRGLLFLCFFLLLLLLPLLCSAQDQLCEEPVSDCDSDTDYFPDKVSITHANATITDIEYSNTYVDFTIVDPTVDDTSWKYRLVRCGCDSDPATTVQVLYTKPSSVLVSETPILSLMDRLLPDLDWLSYTGDGTFIYNEDVLERLDDKKAIALPYNAKDQTDFTQLKDDDGLSLGIIGVSNVKDFVDQKIGKKYLVIGEQNEISPLARAEWMKVVGMLFDISEDANDEFAAIEERYKKTKDLAAGAARWPTVFFNYPNLKVRKFDPEASADINYEWYQPGQNSYIAASVKDANADYRFGFDGRAESRSLSYSEIKGNFSNARFLINAGVFPVSDSTTLREFIENPVDSSVPAAEKDDSFEKLAKELVAVRCGNVWSNQKRVSEAGGSDFFESLAFQPDKYLKELVHIFHPYLGETEETDLFYSYNVGEASEDLVGKKCPFPNLVGDAPDGKKYVDHEFTVPGMGRFQIEDRAEGKILPDLRKTLALDDQSMELFFKKPDDGDNKDTELTVRLSVKEDDSEDFEDSGKVLTSLRSTINKDVAIRESPNEKEPENEGEDGGGLGGGAIFGIILLVVVVVALLVFLVYRYRRGRRGRIGIAGGNDGDWADPDAGAGRLDESTPMAAV